MLKRWLALWPAACVIGSETEFSARPSGEVGGGPNWVAWVFCALVPGAEPSVELAAELRALAAQELGKAFAPERVLFVSALPKTRSAKIVRRAVRAKALGTDPGDLSSLENPETLEEIEHVAAS